MQEYFLSEREEKLVTEIVRMSDEAGERAFTYTMNSKGSYIEFKDAGHRIDLHPDDLQSLKHAGMLEIPAITSGMYTGRVLPPAIKAVQMNFGRTKRQRVLKAMYDLAGGKSRTEIPARAVAEKCGLSIEEVYDAVTLLKAENQAFFSIMVGGNPDVALLPAGVEAVETPWGNSTGHVISAVNYINQMTGGAVQGVQGNNNTVSQAVHINDAEVLKAFGDACAQLLESVSAAFQGYELEQVQKDIAELRYSVQAGAADKGLVKTKVKRIGDAVLSGLDFAADAAEKAQRIAVALAALGGIVATAGKVFAH